MKIVNWDDGKVVGTFPRIDGRNQARRNGNRELRFSTVLAYISWDITNDYEG